jgi:hypothetical protein
MLKINSPVKSVLLREPISLLGKFDLQRMISSDRFIGMQLLYTQHGVSLEYKGVSALIPFANIQVIELVKEEETDK